MKIGMDEILSGIEYAAIQKITKGLVREGFVVKNESTSSGKNGILFDLYAERGDDRRIYELKIGKNKIQNRQFLALQEEAKRRGARLYIIYLEVPRSKEISFTGLDRIIYEDLLNDLPSEIKDLSSQTTIKGIDNLELDSITVSDRIVKLTGSGTINVQLPFSSKTDPIINDVAEDLVPIDFFFKLSMDISSQKIISHYYKIDIEKEDAPLD